MYFRGLPTRNHNRSWQGSGCCLDIASAGILGDRRNDLRIFYRFPTMHSKDREGIRSKCYGKESIRDVYFRGHI